jgi:hypothetical protein
MSADLMHVALRLEGGRDADALEIDQLTSGLRQQLLETDVLSVDRVQAGDAPPGSRGDPVMLLGGLLITALKSPEAIKAVIGTIQSWLASHQTHTIELQLDGDTLKVTGPSTAEQQQLVELFVERHSR